MDNKYTVIVEIATRQHKNMYNQTPAMEAAWEERYTQVLVNGTTNEWVPDDLNANQFNLYCG